MAVTKEEVEALLETVLQMFPQLSEANAIEAMGFPTRATQVLRRCRNGHRNAKDRGMKRIKEEGHVNRRTGSV